MSYPGPPPEYDHAQLHAASEAFRAPSYSPERKRQDVSRFQFAQGMDEDVDMFMPTQGYGFSAPDPQQHGDHRMQNGRPGMYGGDTGMKGKTNGFQTSNPRDAHNPSMQTGNQASQEAHQQALMRAAWEEQRRAGNGVMGNHFNNQQNQSSDAYYDAGRHMTPQSSPGNSVSPTRSQKKGAGRTKNPGNLYL